MTLDGRGSENPVPSTRVSEWLWYYWEPAGLLDLGGCYVADDHVLFNIVHHQLIRQATLATAGTGPAH